MVVKGLGKNVVPCENSHVCIPMKALTLQTSRRFDTQCTQSRSKGYQQDLRAYLYPELVLVDLYTHCMIQYLPKSSSQKVKTGADIHGIFAYIEWETSNTLIHQDTKVIT